MDVWKCGIVQLKLAKCVNVLGTCRIDRDYERRGWWWWCYACSGSLSNSHLIPRISLVVKLTHGVTALYFLTKIKYVVLDWLPCVYAKVCLQIFKIL